MSNHLSHTKLNTYKECPKKYKLHYIDKLRPIVIGSPLVFGSAIDKTLEDLLLHNKDTFDFNFRFQKINNVEEYLPTSNKVSYSNADYDFDLLKQEDFQKLKDELKIEDVLGEINRSFEEKKEFGFKNIDPSRQALINYASWLSLYRKGRLMVEAFHRDIKPKIKSVLGTQIEIKLTNNKGDVITGKPDLIAEWVGYDKPIIIDFKTSSKAYEADSVKLSQQLTTYMHEVSERFLDTRTAGYVVFNKRINKVKHQTCKSCGWFEIGSKARSCTVVTSSKKRCNGEWSIQLELKCNTQIIIDEIPVGTEDIVLQDYDTVNEQIKNEEFDCNTDSCHGIYGKCGFFDLCHGNSMVGLIKLEKK